MERCEDVKRKFNECNVSGLLGITIDHVEEGLARGNMTVTKNHTNVFGGIHGGILFAFADQVGGACGNSMDYKALLVESVARFKKTAREGEVVYAEARLIHSRRQRDTIEINVTNAGGDVLALLTMTSFIVENAAKTP
jgi:phenylacetic acid degradation protein PaaD